MLDSIPQKTVTFELNGKELTVNEGTTIWEAAQAEGHLIPHLCHKPEPGYRSDGNCRACMVEIDGERISGVLRRVVKRYGGASKVSEQ